MKIVCCELTCYVAFDKCERTCYQSLLIIVEFIRTIEILGSSENF